MKMKKKKYITPELDLVMFRLAGSILLSSIEQGQDATAGGSMDDPPSGDPFDILP